MNARHSLLITSLLLPLAACTYSQTPIPTDLPQASPQATSSVTVTSLPSTPESVPATSTSITPYIPFYATAQVENLILRANPGYLFGGKTTLPNNSRLLVLGRSPGGEWLLVQTPLERTGWVFAAYVKSEGDLQTVPWIQPADVQVVRGRIRDGNGKPITGIQFAVVQRASGSPPRNDALTDETGTFYAFMPLDSSGTWTVSFTAVACTSNTMDKDCNCLGGVCGGPVPESVDITLPLDEPLEFLWE